jgi:hypothetical protein
MFTVAPCALPAHYQQVSVLASAPTTAPPSGVLSTVAIVVVIMLLGFALKSVKPVVLTLFDLVRTLFSALGVAALLVLALVVLIGALVVSAAGH